MGTLSGKKAVVVAGSRGIGAASSLALAEAGAEILLTYLTSREPAEEVVAKIKAAGGKAACEKLDATDEAQTRAFGAHVKQALGRVDILFNNAGDMLGRKKTEELDAAHVRKVFDLNVLTTILVVKELLPLMPRGSVIINMSSQAAHDGGGPGAGIYAASKGAIHTLSKAWANEFAPRDIRVLTLAPGVIDTDFHKRHSKPELMDMIAKTSPVNKYGVPEDVARAVMYLAGEGGGFMTGATIDINGGRYMA
ncbi:MAG: SDR family oxidoreductase [Planctomycetes bacterium]|nr:SDR family oxidoreductase [Planctomycetota bacterium]